MTALGRSSTVAGAKLTMDVPWNPHMARRRCICLIARSPIADDPRVRRHGDAFHSAGWQVVAVGLPGGHSARPVWPILSEPPAATSSTRRMMGRIGRLTRRMLALALLVLHSRGIRWGGIESAASYFEDGTIQRLGETASSVDADVYMAN